jgi:membrane protein required for colicin V production
MPELMKVWSAIGLDGALLILGLVSGILAMYRGFTREMLTLANWGIAAGAAYLVGNQRAVAEDLAQKYQQNPTLVQIGLAIVAFLLVLVLMYLFTGRMADRVLDSRIGMIDRMLGFLFGVLRGALLVVILFAFWVKFFPIPKEQEASLTNARSLPYVQRASDALSAALEPLVDSVVKKISPQRGGPEVDEQAPDRPGRQRS